MRKFQYLLLVLKRSYICYNIICMTIPLRNLMWLVNQGTALNSVLSGHVVCWGYLSTLSQIISFFFASLPLIPTLPILFFQSLNVSGHLEIVLQFCKLYVYKPIGVRVKSISHIYVLCMYVCMYVCM